MRIAYYVVYDPERQLGNGVLTVYCLQGASYRRCKSSQFSELNLGLTLWEGKYEGTQATWLRWTDEKGVLIPTGKEQAARERAAKNRERAAKERERAAKEAALAAQARERAEKEAALARIEQLEAQLRALRRKSK
jgi:hypothetical protein